MPSVFKFIKPGTNNRRTYVYETARTQTSSIDDFSLRAMSLADSAGNYFCGLADMSADGGATPLPWFSEYWKEVDEKGDVRSAPIEHEVEDIFSQLAITAREFQWAEPWECVTYLSEALSASQKLTMQGLAVETMLAVEGLLSCIQKRDFHSSLRWLFSANCNSLNCDLLAQEISRSSSLTENARAAANIRHTENRAMKREAFEWLDTNMENFGSMDSAAQAITKQMPIVFRTARDWTGQWKKLRSAGTP